MKYTVNAFHVASDDDSVGRQFPLNTYKTDHLGKVLEAVSNMLTNPISGINKISIIEGDDKEAHVGMAPLNLDEL